MPENTATPAAATPAVLPLSAEELLVFGHHPCSQRHDGTGPHWDGMIPHCNDCDHPWPCVWARLIATLSAATARADAAERQLRGERNSWSYSWAQARDAQEAFGRERDEALAMWEKVRLERDAARADVEMERARANAEVDQNMALREQLAELRALRMEHQTAEMQEAANLLEQLAQERQAREQAEAQLDEARQIVAEMTPRYSAYETVRLRSIRLGAALEASDERARASVQPECPIQIDTSTPPTKREDRCQACEGTGIGRKPEPYICQTCGGTGLKEEQS